METNEALTFGGHLTRCRLAKTPTAPLFYYYFNSQAGKAAIYSIMEQVAAERVSEKTTIRSETQQ